MKVLSPYSLGWNLPSQGETAPPLVFPRRGRSPWVADWVRTPIVAPRPIPEPQRLARQIQQWAGLSNRALAELLDTSHPTVGALLSGQSVDLSRRPEVRERLSNLHMLCERLAPLAPAEPEKLRDVLQSMVEGTRLGQLAALGDIARAYTAALSLLRTPRRTALPKSVFATRAGEATVALHD